jgi:tetratricopeptide (TPR) repeat protein
MRGKFLIATLFITLALPQALFSQTVGAQALQYYNTGRNLESRVGLSAEVSSLYDQAIAAALSERSTGRANADSYAALTWALFRLGRYQEVVTYGLEGVDRFEDYRIIETLGEAYFYIPNYPSSLAFLQRYVNELPQGSRASVAYFFMGEIYRLEGLNNHADIAYTTAIHLEGSNALWHYRLGTICETLGYTTKAISAYREALRLSPGFRDTQERLSALQ